jgi:hypothetical protein
VGSEKAALSVTGGSVDRRPFAEMRVSIDMLRQENREVGEFAL